MSLMTRRQEEEWRRPLLHCPLSLHPCLTTSEEIVRTEQWYVTDVLELFYLVWTRVITESRYRLTKGVGGKKRGCFKGELPF